MEEENQRNKLQKYLDKKYKDDYFEERNSDDDKRVQSFKQEGDFIRKFVSQGKLLDIGCLTGEFYDHLMWNDEIYGVEISDHATLKAKKKRN